MSYIPGSGPISAPIMIVVECPTSFDTAEGKYLSGSFGREIKKLLAESGITTDRCWITAVCKFEVPLILNEKIPFGIRANQLGIDLPAQIQDLQNEVTSINPNVIIALGRTALWALTGKKDITNYRGSLLTGMGHKVVATYNPAHLLYQSKGAEFVGYYNKQIILFDLRRAQSESTSSLLELPSRSLSVCKSSYQLQNWIDIHKKYTRAAADIESINCIPGCIGFSANKNVGITIPLWNHLPNLPFTIPDSDMVQMWILIQYILNHFDIVGQNFKYDEDKIVRLGFATRNVVSDTMLKAFVVNPELPKSLAFNTSICTREPFYKNEGMYEGDVTDLFIGCARDACVTLEIDEVYENDLIELGLRDFYYNFVMKLHELYLHIENQGFKVDSAAREELIRKYIKWDEEINYELFKLVGISINTSSPKQVSILLYETLKIPNRVGTSEEELTQVINNKKTTQLQKRVCELILLDRRIKKTISTYLMALPDFDGRMRTTYFLCLETGRTSTGQQDPPIRPTVEVLNDQGKKQKRVLGVAFQTMTKHGDVGQDVRTMYIADEGEVFINVDSSQAEARVVFLLADDEEALRLIDEIDYHALTASWFFGGTEQTHSKKILGYESPIRFAGKTLRHACHLDASGKRASLSVNTDARKNKIEIEITKEFADIAIAKFHRLQPKIRENFHNGIIACLEKDRTLVAGLPYGIQSDIGGKRTFFERWNDELFRQAFAYIPQRTVTDNTKRAALVIRKRAPDTRILVESHDSLLLSVKEERAQVIGNIAREEMTRPISFKNCSLSRRDLVIPCDIEIGYNYKEFKKFNLVELAI